MPSFTKHIRSVKTSSKSSVVSHIDKALIKDRTFFRPRTLLRSANKFSKVADEFVDEEKDFGDVVSSFFSLFEQFFADQPRKGGVFHPSSLADDPCPRKLYYDVTKAPITNPGVRRPGPRLQRIFDIGTLWHLYIQSILLKTGILEAIEVPVISKRLKINGKCDGILNIDGKRKLLEIKTINSFQFKGLTIRPLDKHLKQASIYAHILDIDEIVFIYIDKDSCELKEICVPVSERHIKSATRTIRKTLTAAEDKKVPERVCDNVREDMALNCIYCSHCFNKK